MPDIILSTLNARYIHASFGLRYLLANLQELRPRAAIMEFEIRQTPFEIVEALLQQKPRIIGLGVYIWNARPALEVVALLKRLRPEIIVVLGGPEVSYEYDHQDIVSLADYTITGEADLAFADLCRSLLAPDTGTNSPVEVTTSGAKQIVAALPELGRLAMPYSFYSEDDIRHRVIYVEASRGCPFTCEFCLSSLDVPVRQFPLEPFLEAMDDLLKRGARQFKFVDRTFNLNLDVSRRILRFFRERWCEGLFLHFEMIPDRLPEALRAEIAWFPAGALQFEIGIQSFNAEVCQRIRRRQDVARTEENFRFLRQHTGVHIHADLIAGLPGESLESFAAGFDRLVGLRPQEIQFGILKRLRGTPIVRHDAEWGMRYSPLPPYDILENSQLDFTTLQRLRRFARYWDLVANSGRFTHTLPLIWSNKESGSFPFWSFLAFSDWLYGQTRQTQSLAPDRLGMLLYRWLLDRDPSSNDSIRAALRADWKNLGRRDLPDWLTDKEEGFVSGAVPVPVQKRVTHVRRQQRHMESGSDVLHGSKS